MVSPCSFSSFSFFRSVPEKSALGICFVVLLSIGDIGGARQNFCLQKSKMPLAGMVYLCVRFQLDCLKSTGIKLFRGNAEFRGFSRFLDHP